MLLYQLWVHPRSVLGVLTIPLQIGIRHRRHVQAVMRACDRSVTAKGDADVGTTGQYITAGGRKRLHLLVEGLRSQGVQPALLDRLRDVIEGADDREVASLRPYVLADRWEAPRRDVLILCLLATRSGLLDLQWQVLCPLCRLSQASVPTLSQLEPHVQCAHCNVEINATLERLIEVTFRPTPAIRVIAEDTAESGPQATPHIVAQQLLRSGEERTLTVPLEEGRYRLRTPDQPYGQLLVSTPEGASEITVRATDGVWPADEHALCTKPVLHLQNPLDHTTLFLLERTAWSDQAVTAADVIMLQVFRDLFAQEVLRPKERISVGTLTILFTDLRASTRLYQEIGDASACGQVLDHFDVLREAVLAEDGLVVKTIGDAVMAAFRHPVAALRAILQAHAALAHPPEGMLPLRLKAGLHHGPCLAVTFNQQIDYFGTTVNVAARLERLSSGDDVIVSRAVRMDPEVGALLAESSDMVAVEPFAATLKGFEQDQVELYRITAKLVAGGVPEVTNGRPAEGS